MWTYSLYLDGRSQDQALPVPDPGHQIEAQQMSQGENGHALALGVGVHGGRLDLGSVLEEEALDDVDGLPHPHGMKCVNSTMYDVSEMWR